MNPQLIDLIKRLINNYECPSGGYEYPEDELLINEAKAAIAKAEQK